MKLASLLSQPAASTDSRHLPADDRSFFESWDKPVKEVTAPEPSATPSSKPKSRKKTVTPVRGHAELVMHFTQLLHGDPDLHWTFAEPLDGSPIAQLELDMDGRTQAFTPVYELKPSQARLRKVRAAEGAPPALLLTTELTAGMQAACREHRLCALDLNGRTLMRAPGLLVDRAPLPGRAYKHEVEPRNIFAGKSARILRTLLTDVSRPWSQGDVVARTQASTGLVSRIAQHLISQELATRTTRRDLQVTHPTGLLEAWAATDHFEARTKSLHFEINERSPLEVAHTIRAWAKSQHVQIAFTRQFAASLRYPEGVTPDTAEDSVSVYLSAMPDAAALEQMDFRVGGEDDSEGGSRQISSASGLWLHVPDDEGVFLETQPSFRYVGILQQHLDLDLPLASDAQIYLDLLRMSPQAAEQAHKFREWEGFCRGGGKV
jgi:hypothetical protein